MKEQTPPCQICGNAEGNTRHTVREMMFGTREEFQYLECARCGCIQLLDVPADLSQYYPEGYYSFEGEQAEEFGLLRNFLRRQKHSYCLHGKNPVGKMLAERAGVPPHFAWMQGGGLDFHSEILDVGCGAGSLLNLLRRDGFTRLTGADPFIKDSITYPNGVVIWKKTLAELDGQYDFVMLHHAFEHMAEPLATLKEIKRLLKPGRSALIRIPIADSFAWRNYGVHWVQLDAPRHLFLHTVDSMTRLAGLAGLELASVFYDSNSLQFTGSERYQRSIALTEGQSEAPFSEAELAAFERRAVELNQQGQGDQAGFYLKKGSRG